MEDQQSQVRSVEEINIMIKHENEYFDKKSESESDDEDLYLYEKINQNESDGDGQLDLIEQTPPEDEQSTDEERECKRRKYSDSSSESQQSSFGNYIWPCGRNGAENVNNPLEAWSILLTDEILNIIVRYTNEEINRRRVGLNSAQEDNYLHADLSLVEFKALLGLLYFSGLHKVTFIKTIDLWSSFGLPVYRATMPRDRFAFLMTCIRFDDKATRHERCKIDKFSPIREIFDNFINNCKKYYTPHDNCTVGKILVPCPKPCKYCEFISESRGKHGIKVLMINDSKTHYMINASLYVKTINTEPRETIHAYHLRTLTQPIHGSGRSVTCSINWPLYTHVMETLKTDYNLTLASMVETEDPEIPDEFFLMPSTQVELKCLESGILLPYYRKGCHIGTLQSSLHVNPIITSQNERLKAFRKTRNFYELTKSATNLFYILCSTYSTKRATSRWPVCLFTSILDQCRFNSFILYQLNAKNKVHTHRSFLQDLIINLIKPFIKLRINDPCTSKRLKLLMSTTFDIDI